MLCEDKLPNVIPIGETKKEVKLLVVTLATKVLEEI